MPEAPPDVPDEDLTSRLLIAARSHPAAFADLYSSNAERIVAFFYRRTRCSHTSRDLAAETFAQAFEARHRYEPTGVPGIAWLYGVAGNVYREWVRRSIVGQAAHRRAPVEIQASNGDELERIEQLVDFVAHRDALQIALGRLAAGIRCAIVLRVALDLSYSEVADALGCSIGAARVRVSRGLGQFNTMLKPR